jgi:hypothetical protein
VAPGYEGCSGEDPGEYVANPVDLGILALTQGWYGCSQAGDLVLQFHLHGVSDTAVDLEWWIWERP